MNRKKSPQKLLGVFPIVMITVGSVDSIRNLPATALLGSHLIFYFLLAAVFFFLPCALVSAELSSVRGQTGGIYGWVKDAFGIRAGFLAVWFQWAENVIWYPTILAFIAGSLGYLFSPEWALNNYFIIAVIVVAIWSTTLINLRGILTSSHFANFCTIVGLLFPMILIIGLGGYWYFSGHPLFIDLHAKALVPHSTTHDMWIVLTAMMMSFAGIEIATVHATDVKTPLRTYPLAMLLSVIILLITLMGGSLAIAISVPQQQLSPLLGIMQSFNMFFINYHMHWFLPIVALMLVVGGLGGVNNWVIAPTRGLLIAAEDGSLPAVWRKKNKRGAPTVLLIFQAVLVTLMAGVFTLFPSVNASYWLLTALAAQLYVIMYMLMFASAYRQRQKKSIDDYGFRIPGGRIGFFVVCLLGLLACIVIFMIGFIPPTDTNIGSPWFYEIILLAGLVVMSLPPFIIYWLCHRKDYSDVK